MSTREEREQRTAGVPDAAFVRRPSLSQLDKIRDQSAIVLGDRERLFRAVGMPESAADASTMLGALHKVRNQMKPLPGNEAAMYNSIELMKNGKGPSTESQEAVRQAEAAKGVEDQVEEAEAEKEEPVAEPQFKKCSGRCGGVKPVADFGKVTSNPDGLAYVCKQCTKEKRDAKNAAAGKPQRSKPKDEPRFDPPPEDLVLPDVTVASSTEWWRRFEDPTLSQLVELRDQLGAPTLDDVAAICRFIVNARGKQ